MRQEAKVQHFTDDAHTCSGEITGRALVPVESLRPRRSLTPAVRTSAPFLSHLIATAAGDPQTRERRRAEPEQAVNAYAAMMHAPTEAGRSVHESR
jgi:hypothetical protein